jgi:hypothetical protein
LRIDPGHDVPDGAVLAGGVHPLKNQQQRIAVGRVVKLLQRAQLLNVFSRSFDTASSTCKRASQSSATFEFDLSFRAAHGNPLNSIFIFIPFHHCNAIALGSSLARASPSPLPNLAFRLSQS